MMIILFTKSDVLQIHLQVEKITERVDVASAGLDISISFGDASYCCTKESFQPVQDQRFLFNKPKFLLSILKALATMLTYRNKTIYFREYKDKAKSIVTFLSVSFSGPAVYVTELRVDTIKNVLRFSAEAPLIYSAKDMFLKVEIYKIRLNVNLRINKILKDKTFRQFLLKVIFVQLGIIYISSDRRFMAEEIDTF